jgi:hypothetical protein
LRETLRRYPPRIDLLRKAAGCRIPVPNKLRPFSSVVSAVLVPNLSGT